MKELLLSQGQRALVDDEDFPRVSVFRWCYRAERDGRQGYAVRHVRVGRKDRLSYLHREIMNPAPGHEVIFLDHDRLNCQKSNLKVVTKQDALRYHRVRRDSGTGLKGIRYNRYAGTWSVDFYEGGDERRVGTFLTREEAIEARELANQRYEARMAEEREKAAAGADAAAQPA